MKSAGLDLNWFGGFPGGRFIGQEELAFLEEVVRAKSPYRFYGLDPRRMCLRLEQQLSERWGMPYVLALSSGTAAVHAALFAVGVRAGDEVILPAYAWSADVMAILALGAVPVIAPLDSSLGLDPAALRACCTKNTRAVLAVHMRGAPCDIAALREETRRLGLPLIEDCAQCLGGAVSGQAVGTFGDVAAYSFQYNKLITCGEGGALATRDREIWMAARRFHDLGMIRELGQADPCGPRAIESFGLNYRMSELQAAMLLAQVRKMDTILSRLRETYAAVDRAMTDLRTELRLKPRSLPSGAAPNGAFYGLQTADGLSASSAVAVLRQNGLPAQACGNHDPHHFAVWIEFLRRESRPYRIVGAEKSQALLDQSLFLELNPSGLS